MVVFATSYPPHHPSYPPPLLAILTAEKESKKCHEIQLSEIEKVGYNKIQWITKYFTAQHTGTVQS